MHAIPRAAAAHPIAEIVRDLISWFSVQVVHDVCRASWLARTLQWFHTHVEDEYIGDLEQDVERAVARIQDLYLIAQAGVQERHKVIGFVH